MADLVGSNLKFSSAMNVAEKLSAAADKGIVKFLVFFEAVKPHTGFPKDTPHLLKRELMLALPEGDFTLQFLRRGQLLLQTGDISVALRAVEIKSILGVPASPSVKYENMTSRFLLRGIDPSVELSELVNELEGSQSFKVCEIVRFNSRINRGPSSTVLVSVFGSGIPLEVKLWYQIFRCAPFYDRPRACVNCLRFDHPSKACTRDQVCARCGRQVKKGEVHDFEGCLEPIKCGNCGGSHFSSDRRCEAYKREVELCEFKAENHLSFAEARRQFAANKKRKSNSYARVTSGDPACQFVTKRELETAMHGLAVSLQTSFVTTMKEQVNALAKNLQDQIASTFRELSSTLFLSNPFKNQETSNVSLGQNIGSGARSKGQTRKKRRNSNPLLQGRRNMDWVEDQPGECDLQDDSGSMDEFLDDDPPEGTEAAGYS